MKKIISVIMTIFMLASISLSAFAIDFSDFTSAHWAYNYVNTLVSDGTINGFEDGTFRPEDTVTRAQFVKMIGNGPEIRNTAFDDVAQSHWAYSYIMSSGLEPLSGNSFMPDVPITRGDVAVLLWKRAGSPKGITAPPVINRQSDNHDAASWVYTNSIMVGDDFVNLRLEDTLTRAEASALIIRSREVNANTAKTYFSTAIDSAVYEKVYNAFKLIDREYSADATLTNGELSMALARLHSGMDDPTYLGLFAESTFEHKYALPINLIARYYMGLENDNAQYADKNATIKEAIAAVMFATSKTAPSYAAPEADGNYPTYTLSGNKELDGLLSDAYCCGIMTYEASTLDMNKDVTMKELAQLVLEFNGFGGFHLVTDINSSGYSDRNVKIRANTATYPQNSDNYRIIIDEVPNYVYEADFASAKNLPKDNYQLSNGFREILVYMLTSWVKDSKAAGYELELKYYPGMAVENGNGYTTRCKLDVKSVPSGTKLSDIVNCVNAADGAVVIDSGSTLYVDIDTGKHLDSVVIGTEKMTLSQVIR